MNLLQTLFKCKHKQTAETVVVIDGYRTYRCYDCGCIVWFPSMAGTKHTNNHMNG
jgi:hypothetical protein